MVVYQILQKRLFLGQVSLFREMLVSKRIDLDANLHIMYTVHMTLGMHSNISRAQCTKYRLDGNSFNPEGHHDIVCIFA